MPTTHFKPMATMKSALPGVSWPFAPTVSSAIPEKAISGGPRDGLQNQQKILSPDQRVQPQAR
jgi:hypothetical protein